MAEEKATPSDSKPAESDVPVAPRRRWADPPTRGSIVADWIFGVALPLVCIALDPMVFQGQAPGDTANDGYLHAIQPLAYTWIALEIACLSIWLVFQDRCGAWSGFLGGVLLAGGTFALVLGIALLPFTLPGLVLPWLMSNPFANGKVVDLLVYTSVLALGLSPFLTARTYLRCSKRARTVHASLHLPLGPRIPSTGFLTAVFLAVLGQVLVPTISYRGLCEPLPPLDGESVAFLEDQTLLHGGSEGLKLWDPHSGAILRWIEEKGCVTALTVSRDRSLIALGRDDGDLLLWRREGEEWTKVLATRILDERIRALAFSRDGRCLAVIGAGGRLQVVDIEARPAEARGKPALLLSVDAQLAAAFSPEEDLLFSGGKGGAVLVWSTREWKLLRELEGHRWPVRAMAVSPDGKTLVTGSGTRTLSTGDPIGEVLVWDLTTGKSRSFGEGEKPLRPCVDSLEFLPDGRHLVGIEQVDLKSRAGSIPASEACFLDLETHDIESGFDDRPTRAACSPDGQFLAFGQAWYPGTCLRRELRTALVSVHDAKTLTFLRGLGAESRLEEASVSPDGSLLAASCSDGSLLLWETDSGRCRWKSAAGRPNFMTFSPDGRKLAVHAERLGCIIFDTLSGKSSTIAESFPEALDCVAFSSDGNGLVGATAEGRVILSDLLTGEPHVLDSTMDPYREWVGFWGDHRIVAAGGEIDVWDAAEDKPSKEDERSKEREPSNRRNPLRTFSREGRGRDAVLDARIVPGTSLLVLAACHDVALEVWDLETGLRVRLLEAQNEEILGLDCSADGTLVASRTEHRVTFWDLATGEATRSVVLRPAEPASGRTSRAALRPLSLSPKGDWFAATYARGSSETGGPTVYLCDPKTGAVLKSLETP